MKGYAWVLMTAGLIAGPTTASAVTVTWGVNGVITEANDNIPGPFTGILVGDEFEVLVTFDTEAPLLGTLSFPPGELHFFDPSSIVLSIRIGALDPVTIPWVGPGSGNPFFGNALYVRDDSGDQAPQGEPVAQDGFSFGLEYADGLSVAVLLRGSILDIVSGPDLPETPDPRMIDWETLLFSGVRFDPNGDPTVAESLFLGDIHSIRAITSVPEPGSLALLGLGLAGMGFARRRKPADSPSN